MWYHVLVHFENRVFRGLNIHFHLVHILNNRFNSSIIHHSNLLIHLYVLLFCVKYHSVPVMFVSLICVVHLYKKNINVWLFQSSAHSMQTHPRVCNTTSTLQHSGLVSFPSVAPTTFINMPFYNNTTSHIGWPSPQRPSYNP